MGAASRSSNNIQYILLRFVFILNRLPCRCDLAAAYKIRRACMPVRPLLHGAPAFSFNTCLNSGSGYRLLEFCFA